MTEATVYFAQEIRQSETFGGDPDKLAKVVLHADHERIVAGERERYRRLAEEMVENTVDRTEAAKRLDEAVCMVKEAFEEKVAKLEVDRDRWRLRAEGDPGATRPVVYVREQEGSVTELFATVEEAMEGPWRFEDRYLASAGDPWQSEEKDLETDLATVWIACPEGEEEIRISAIEIPPGCEPYPTLEEIEAGILDREEAVDLGGPEASRRWIVTSGHPADHPDARNAAIHARLTGSVGASYNGVHVVRADKRASTLGADDDTAQSLSAKTDADVAAMVEALARRLYERTESLRVCCGSWDDTDEEAVKEGFRAQAREDLEAVSAIPMIRSASDGARGDA